MKERDERPAKKHGPGHGIGFLHLRHPDDMRVALLWEAEAPDGWESTFRSRTANGPWKDGGLNFRAYGRHDRLINATRHRRANYFHPEVADRVLDGDNRRSLTLRTYADYTGCDDAATDGDTPALRIGALEVLKVSESPGSCSVILAVHAIVPSADYRRYCTATIGIRALDRLEKHLTSLLQDPEVCANHPVTLARHRGGHISHTARPLLTITWVPQWMTRRWESTPDDNADTLSRRVEVPVSADIMDLLRESTQGQGQSTVEKSTVKVPHSLAATSGWQWTEFPSSTGIELDEEAYASSLHRTHLLSQSWAITVGERGVAYLPRQEDDFLCEGMLRAFSTYLDVHLLIALDRLRVRLLSRKISETAKGLKELTRAGTESKQALADLDPLIDASVELDSDAVAFLASEWWTDISSQRRPDHILAWMREACGLDEAVSQVVEQARLLRESIQTLIDREEHRVDLERQKTERQRQETERQRQVIEREQQESSRMMEWALGVLAFVGIPLSVLLEIWINWDPSKGLWERHWLWWSCGLGVVLGAVGVGLILAKAFNVKLGRPPRGLSLAKEPAPEADPKHIASPPGVLRPGDHPQEPPPQKE